MMTLPACTPNLRTLLLGSLLLGAGCTSQPGTPVTVAPTPAPPASAPTAPGAFDDDPRPPSAAERAVTEAGLAPAKLASAQAELLGMLLSPQSEPAAAQEAAQRLGYILLVSPAADNAAALNALAPLLVDPTRSDFARLALDRVPGESVDMLYLQALLKASGRIRLGLIDAVATRGIRSAVPPLAGLLRDPDAATADAATRALGRLGGAEALDALAQATNPRAPVVLQARLNAAAKAGSALAGRIAGEIYHDSSVSIAQRAAALRLLIASDATAAVDNIQAALANGEPAFRAVALEAVSTLPVTDAGGRLASRLRTYGPETQTVLITALGHRHDASAVPGILDALDQRNPEIQAAAVEALGRLPGDDRVARRLARLAAGRGDLAEVASASLARLDGPGLDQLVRDGAANEGDEAIRSVFIRQIAARNLTDAIPFLLGLRQSPSANLRLEALDALRQIAPAGSLPALVDWAVDAPDRAEQTRAVRAIIATVLRDDDAETRADPVLRALDRGDTAARLVLLPVLSRATGPRALDAAARLGRDADESVALAATAELARWPDASSLPALVDLAVATRSERVRTSAVQGAGRYLAQSRENADRRSAQVRALLDLPLNAAARRSLLDVLSLCGDEAALATAKKFLADPDVATSARDAVDAIVSNLAGPIAVSASIDPGSAPLMSDGNASTFWQVPGEKGAWIRLDLHSARPVRKLILEHTGRGWGYPGAFEIQVSDDPDQPGEAVARGEGERDETVALLPSGTRGRYVWLRILSLRDAPLAIGEIRVE